MFDITIDLNVKAHMVSRVRSCGGKSQVMTTQKFQVTPLAGARARVLYKKNRRIEENPEVPPFSVINFRTSTGSLSACVTHLS